MSDRIPCYFNEIQLEFKPLYEWALGNKITHPETTARAESIHAALSGSPDDFELLEPKQVPLSTLRQTHSYKLVTLYTTAMSLPEDETFYPSVFPQKGMVEADPTNLRHAGCFCFDSGTPLNCRTWDAAAWSAASAYDAAGAIRRGKNRLAYSLSRPPGHHASRDYFGGYSYFNNSAIAAKRLRREGRIAILDIDYHHGNGTQSIFFRDAGVLTISLHGDPRDSYPYFAGFASETGAGPGDGFNLNVPLPRGTTAKRYISEIKKHVMPMIHTYDPMYLIVAAGWDTYIKDPIGDFRFETDDFHDIGELIGRLHYPTVVIQEGGYYTPQLGKNAKSFLLGVRTGMEKKRYTFRA